MPIYQSIHAQEDEEGTVIPVVDRLQLSAENVSLSGVYLLDRYLTP